MTQCKRIKKIIDEADQPDLLPYSAAQHVASCVDCRGFADERVKLRQLLTSPPRVSVPANFDAVLREKLADTKARRSFNWFSPAGYLRLGAAAAALMIAAFAVQYNVLLKDDTSPATAPVSQRADSRSLSQPLDAAQSPVTAGRAAAQVEAAALQPPLSLSSSRGYSARPVERRMRAEAHTVAPAAPDGVAMGGGAVLLMRSSNAEREVSMPAVSVGAQPLLYVNAGRQQPRDVATSF